MLRAIYVDAVDDKGNTVRPSGASAEAVPTRLHLKLNGITARAQRHYGSCLTTLRLVLNGITARAR